MFNVLKYKELGAIEQFLRDTNYDNGNIEIRMYLETQERLNKLDREYFKLTNGSDAKYEEREVKELTIVIGNVVFKYLVKKNVNDSESNTSD